MSIKNLKPNFCPECGIGLNNSEKRLGFCYNCKANWEPADYEFDEEDSQEDDELFEE